MDDLISRQEAIDALDCINGVEEVLRSLPTVQPERKKGEWLFNVRGCHGFTCPYCGIHKAFKHNFCPNCGADLRGEKDG